jgi:hypothetical protein
VQELAGRSFPIALLLPEAKTTDKAADRALVASLPGVRTVIRFDGSLGDALAAAAEALGVPLERGVFVGADYVHRGVAARHGLTPVPHLILADAVLRGEQLAFVRITGQRDLVERQRDMLPYALERLADGNWSLLGVAIEASIVQAVGAGLHVHTLPLDPGTEAPLIVQLDGSGADVSVALSGVKVLESDGLRTLVAISADRPTDALGIHGAHGHFQLLTPSPDLLRPAPPSEDAQTTATWAARLPMAELKLRPIENGHLADWPHLWGCPTSAATLQADVDRYSGMIDPGGGPIISRHSRHPDNARAVDLLLADLRTMGYCAYTHSFQHAGRTLKNVIADLPGKGRFRLVPDIRVRVRDILIPNPPDPAPETRPSIPSWVAKLGKLVDLDALAAMREPNGFDHSVQRSKTIDTLPPSELRRLVERVFKLEPWFPWWLKRCPLPGPGAEIVIVGCHLDSTAASDLGYDPVVGAAPGRDDDASGLAATLAIARHFAGLKGKLTHTVRFCFFNAEESGLVGSKAYAAAMKAAGAPIRAIICMEMIGYNSDANRIFEVHAGYTDPAVRDASVPIAERVAAWAASLGALAPAQIYKGTSSCCGGNRDLVDGAIERSDHAAFHQQGYPAVVVSEDFFTNLPSEPGADPNPQYHRAADTVIDSAYAADIACAVALTVKEFAS